MTGNLASPAFPDGEMDIGMVPFFVAAHAAVSCVVGCAVREEAEQSRQGVLGIEEGCDDPLDAA